MAQVHAVPKAGHWCYKHEEQVCYEAAPRRAVHGLLMHKHRVHTMLLGPGRHPEGITLRCQPGSTATTATPALVQDSRSAATPSW